MAITPPTPPTPPSPPKITLGDAARDAQANTTHTTGDAQAEQQARDSVAQGNGALSKTTTGAPKAGDTAERPNAAARTDAAKGDAVSTSAAKVDRGTTVEGQKGADVAKGLDLAQENAALKQQLANTEQKPPEAPTSYTATSGLYWVGMIGVALVVGIVAFRRFFQKKEQTDVETEPSLGERILARERAEEQGATSTDAQEKPRTTSERGAHDDLLAAAERTRRARDTRSEILPEFTGLTAGEALARLMEEERADVRPAERQSASPKAAQTQQRAPAAPPPSPVVSATPPPSQPVKRIAPQESEEEKPRFEVRV
ncbi:hypothetical protein AXF19_06090 [Selenomonas sp. oral taxon 126]|uniref:hypothetical protein n=1 Tax=Selenomonas sp. oral taxon 126 TaxID=712528 RepID=UPI0008079ED1|nr:hypothetical protein [Selenomonas sp. oral taxon 126]ANR70591.1 hypothetical protein AXF19_06090 [Selenomonas sp. oral taxon 126]